MSEQIKFIIQELNKDPFNKKFNLISFDSLRTENLLQILNDAFSTVDPKVCIFFFFSLYEAYFHTVCFTTYESN